MCNDSYTLESMFSIFEFVEGFLWVVRCFPRYLKQKTSATRYMETSLLRSESQWFQRRVSGIRAEESNKKIARAGKAAGRVAF